MQVDIVLSFFDRDLHGFRNKILSLCRNEECTFRQYERKRTRVVRLCGSNDFAVFSRRHNHRVRKLFACRKRLVAVANLHRSADIVSTLVGHRAVRRYFKRSNRVSVLHFRFQGNAVHVNRIIKPVGKRNRHRNGGQNGNFSVCDFCTVRRFQRCAVGKGQRELLRFDGFRERCKRIIFGYGGIGTVCARHVPHGSVTEGASR